MLMTRLENQSPLTQTAQVGALNDTAGLDKEDGMEIWVPFNWASC
jgi:hypothetical protein